MRSLVSGEGVEEEEKGQVIGSLQTWDFGVWVCWPANIDFNFFNVSLASFISSKHISSCTVYIREEISEIIKCFALTVKR